MLALDRLALDRLALDRLALDRRLGRLAPAAFWRSFLGPDPTRRFGVVPDLAGGLGARRRGGWHARRDDRRHRAADPERAQPLLSLGVSSAAAHLGPGLSRLPILSAIARAITVRLARPRSPPALAPPGHDYARRQRTGQSQ